MAQASISRPMAPPWSLRLLEAAPIAPVWTATAIALILLVVYFGVEYATGQLGLALAGEAKAHIPIHFRIATVNILAIGYLPAAQTYLARWTRRHLAELRPFLGSAEDAWPDPFTSRSRRVHGAIGAVALPFVFLVLPGNFVYLQREYWIFEHAWEWASLPVIGWLSGRLVYALVSDARTFSRIASDLEGIDLFDPSCFTPFVSQGLRSALLVIILLVIGSGLIGAKNVSQAPVALVLTTTFGIATAALILPVRGARRRIRQEKAAKLSALRDVLRRSEQVAMGGGPEADRVRAGLPGLLALEARIEAVREWPFDAPTLLRFAFYLSLGLGSWLGAAAVERLLDRALT